MACGAAAFGTRPDEQVRNGDFTTGNLSGWNVVIDPNTNVSFGFPRRSSHSTSTEMGRRMGRCVCGLAGPTPANLVER